MNSISILKGELIPFIIISLFFGAMFITTLNELARWILGRNEKVGTK
jgi:hypothetical protein